jgi:hypothetical protein
MKEALDRFFFGYSNPHGAALFRILFCFTLLLNLLMRLPHAELYYTDLSGIPSSGATALLPTFYEPSFDWYPRTLFQVYFMIGLQVLALLWLMIGSCGPIGSRLLAFLALITHIGLMQRNISIVYGADIVSTFWLFGLCFIDSTEVWSWRSYRRRVEDGRVRNDGCNSNWSKTLTSAGVRLSQIQLCLIYGYSGFEKLKGGDWWDQTAIWKVLGNEQLMTSDLSFLRSVPLVIGLLTWGTVLFEVYAPVLLWVKATRRWVFVAGWLLHVGIAATMGLFVFSMTMMAGYLLFLQVGDIQVFQASIVKKIGGNRGVT